MVWLKYYYLEESIKKFVLDIQLRLALIKFCQKNVGTKIIPKW